eukprot:CAMPEP_0174889592 /NCGR_PEP_ID=MMETSP0167-20121228/4800_1 /TAXON_ID=38298 /ORGANISM="Rhodella maculata, Strain CCMP736" /LENGTH=362 /DNA_ID=CAMNT_0016127031 /DNA_START=68 /DNA_END=1156 /DNA_ORIENTATION=+
MAEKRIACPKHLVGRVIGPKGATIQTIQQESGAKVTVDRNTDAVVISGPSEASVAKAVELVTAIVNPPSKTLTCDREYVKDIIGKGGANIKRMREESGARISVETEKDPVKIKIEAPNQESLGTAVALINGVIKPAAAEKIECPKQYASQIVGENGATLRGLESKHRVKIIMDSTSDPVIVHIEGARASGVAAAVAQVRTIIATATNPDYEGPDGQRFRREAERCAKERARLYDSASVIFDAAKRGEAADKDAAYKMVEDGKAAGAAMEAANAKAAEAIVAFNNEGMGEMHLDLHGLKVSEALAVLQKRLDEVRGKGELEIIPGAGHHSENAALIKPKVEAMLKERYVRFHAKNAGTIVAIA